MCSSDCDALAVSHKLTEKISPFEHRNPDLERALYLDIAIWDGR